MLSRKGRHFKLALTGSVAEQRRQAGQNFVHREYTGTLLAPRVPDVASNVAVLLFNTQNDWEAWLADNHGTAADAWLRLAKKGSDIRSVSYAEALEIALCYGWIDAQKRPESEQAWLQRFTPRRTKSIWSKINRDKAAVLIKAGRMRPAGLKQVDLAKKDGRWDAAYDSPRGAEVPDDLQAALNKNARARAFFATLDRANRYAVLFRIQTAKKAETRERRIRDYVDMLARHEKLHP